MDPAATSQGSSVSSSNGVAPTSVLEKRTETGDLPGAREGGQGMRIALPEANGKMELKPRGQSGEVSGGSSVRGDGDGDGNGDAEPERRTQGGRKASDGHSAREIIAPRFWVKGCGKPGGIFPPVDGGEDGSAERSRSSSADVAGAKVVEESDSGEDTSDEAFEQRHSVRRGCVVLRLSVVRWLYQREGPWMAIRSMKDSGWNL